MSKVVARKSLVRAVALALPMFYGFNGAAVAAVPTALETHLEDSANPDVHLAGTSSTVVSSDGKFVYVAAGIDGAITAYSRDATTGALTEIAAYRSIKRDINDAVFAALGGASRIGLSPDGKYLAVSGFMRYSSSGAVLISTFARNPETGLLSYQMSSSAPSFNYIGARMAFSPDGNEVLTVSNRGAGINVWMLEAGHMYAFKSFYSPDDTTPAAAADLTNPQDIAISADGKSVYVVGRDAANSSGDLVVLERNSVDGAFNALESHKNDVAGVTGLSNPRAVAVSADGKNVYVASAGALATFNRADTGALTFAEATSFVDDATAKDVLAGAQTLTIAADGRTIYVGTSDKILAVFSRNIDTGALSPEGFLVDGVDGVSLGVSQQMAITADGASLFVASNGDAVDGLSVFNSASVADVSVSVAESANSVVASGAYGYTFTVTNDGPSAAVDALLEIGLPDGVTLSNVAGPSGVECEPETGGWHCHLGTLDAGATLVVTADATAPATVGDITTSANVTSATIDPAGGNNSAEIALSVVDTPAAAGPSDPAAESGGGGGGALNLYWLLLGGIAGAARLRSTKK